MSDDATDGSEVTVRQARTADEDAVAAFTSETWSDRGGGDYIPSVFPEWVRTDGDDQRTFVAEVDGEVVGLGQGVLLSPTEGWGQGLRVDPDYRGRGVSTAITYGLFDWARERGATVVRNMVFSWNAAGLGQSRAVGYEPATEFRWVHPDPDPEGVPPRTGAAGSTGVTGGPVAVTDDPDVAWRFWSDSATRDHLGGLALSMDESWALAELAPDTLRRAADETRVFAVESPRGARGCAYRTRTYERDGEDGPETHAEYGVGAWADLDAARALFSGIARDAADLGADRTRVLVPETPRAVSDAAFLRVGLAEEPDFVLAADLTGDYRG